jgi:hypothetical protein
MLRAGQSLPPKGLSTLRFDAGRFPPTPAACYRASWQLPGPDSHRLADTSLRVDYLNATTSKGDITSRTHAAGHTKLPLEPDPVPQAQHSARAPTTSSSFSTTATRSG